MNTNWSFNTMGANRKVYDAQGYLNYRRDWYVAQNAYGIDPDTGNYIEYGATWVPKKVENRMKALGNIKLPSDIMTHPHKPLSTNMASVWKIGLEEQCLTVQI